MEHSRKAEYQTGAKRCIQNVKYKLFIVQELPKTVVMTDKV